MQRKPIDFEIASGLIGFLYGKDVVEILSQTAFRLIDDEGKSVICATSEGR